MPSSREREPYKWHVTFPWTAETSSALAEFRERAINLGEIPLGKGRIELSSSNLGVLPRVRGRLRDLGVDFEEQGIAPDVTGGRAWDATLMGVPYAEFRYAEIIGEHPVTHQRCLECEVEGFAALDTHPVKLRFHKRPQAGLIYIANERGMHSGPAPWLFGAVSAELREHLVGESLATGLQFFDIDVSRKGTGSYYGILPTARLGSMATPYGPHPTGRNCVKCGYVNADFLVYPLYPRPETPADWFLAAPLGAMDILISRRIFDWLTGPGWPMAGSGRPSRVNSRRAGWWPDERAQAFLPEEYQGSTPDAL